MSDILTIEYAAEKARELKAGCDWDDLAPMLHVVPKDGPELIGIMQMDVSFLDVVVRHAIGVTGPIAGLICYLDSYVLTEDATAETQLRPGELQERWAAGDRDGISEAIVLNVVLADGTYTVGILRYDAVARTFSEPFVSKNFDGRVPDMLIRAIYGVSKERWS